MLHNERQISGMLEDASDKWSGKKAPVKLAAYFRDAKWGAFFSSLLILAEACDSESISKKQSSGDMDEGIQQDKPEDESASFSTTDDSSGSTTNEESTTGEGTTYHTTSGVEAMTTTGANTSTGSQEECSITFDPEQSMLLFNGGSVNGFAEIPNKHHILYSNSCALDPQKESECVLDDNEWTCEVDKITFEQDQNFRECNITVVIQKDLNDATNPCSTDNKDFEIVPVRSNDSL